MISKSNIRNFSLLWDENSDASLLAAQVMVFCDAGRLGQANDDADEIVCVN